MIKFLGLFFVTFVILGITGSVDSYSIKPVNGKNGKSGFFQIVDDLLDGNGKKSKGLMQDKEVLICKNCTIIIAAASNGSSAGNRLSVGNNNAASAGLDESGSNGLHSSGVDSYGIAFPPLYGGPREPSNGAATNGDGAGYIGADVSAPAAPAVNIVPANVAASNGADTGTPSNVADTIGAGDVYGASAYGEGSYVAAAAPANDITDGTRNGGNYASDDDKSIDYL